MEISESKNAALFVRVAPLIIYEITFAFFIIYYIQGGVIWFKISFFSIVAASLTSIAKIFSSYGQWNILPESNRKIQTIGLFFNFLFFTLYLFCLLVQADQWKPPFSPHLITIPFLAVPPLFAFALFLYGDSRTNTGMPNSP